jgi:hypothetical protein
VRRNGRRLLIPSGPMTSPSALFIR